MNRIPDIQDTDNAIILRTDFSNEAVWKDLRRILERVTEEGYRSYAYIVDNPEYANIAEKSVRGILPGNYLNPFVIIVDRMTIDHPDHPVLFFYFGEHLEEGSPQALRVVASEAYSIEANLSIANVDFEEFVAAADEDGIFRGSLVLESKTKFTKK